MLEISFGVPRTHLIVVSVASATKITRKTTTNKDKNSELSAITLLHVTWPCHAHNSLKKRVKQKLGILAITKSPNLLHLLFFIAPLFFTHLANAYTLVHQKSSFSHIQSNFSQNLPLSHQNPSYSTTFLNFLTQFQRLS